MISWDAVLQNTDVKPCSTVCVHLYVCVYVPDSDWYPKGGHYFRLKQVNMDVVYKSQSLNKKARLFCVCMQYSSEKDNIIFKILVSFSFLFTATANKADDMWCLARRKPLEMPDPHTTDVWEPGSSTVVQAYSR